LTLEVEAGLNPEEIAPKALAMMIAKSFHCILATIGIDVASERLLGVAHRACGGGGYSEKHGYQPFLATLCVFRAGMGR